MQQRNNVSRAIYRLAPHNGGLRQQRRLRPIWEAAGQPIGCRPGPAMALEAELVEEAMKSVKEQLDRVEQAIEQLAEGFEEYRYLKSIPGFGPYVAAKMLVIAWTLMKRKEPFNPAFIQS